MARRRETFDPSLKLEIVRVIKEQGLSVQNVSETMSICANGNPAIVGAVWRIAERPAGHWQPADRRAMVGMSSSYP